MATPLDTEEIIADSEVKKQKKPLKLFAHLTREVTLNMCGNCGACVTACPTGAIEIIDNRISLKGKCIACGICYEQCPQLENNWDIAEKIFGKRPKPDSLGVYTEAYSVSSTSPDIQAVGHDAGTVTEILSSLLESGYIDGAVVMTTSKDPWRPWPTVARTRREVMEAAGSKYSPAPLLLGLHDAVELHGCRNIAIVGLPCQIKAVRQMQTCSMNVPQITDSIKFTIGLFCTRVFPYDKTYKKILEEEMGIDLSNVAKFDIKKGNFTIYQKGQDKIEIPVKALRKYSAEHCKVCLDFASELADISVGNVGSPSGKTTVMIRSDAGKEAFTQARRGQNLKTTPLKNVRPGIKSVKKLSQMKKKQNMIEINRRKGKDAQLLPTWLQDSASKESE